MRSDGVKLRDSSATVKAQAEPSRAEREEFANILREGVGAGLLTLPEFETRLDTLYAASSVAELEALVRWLPLSQLPSRRRKGARRMGAVAAAAAIAAAVIVSALFVVARRPAELTAPVISRLGTTTPFQASSELTVIYVTWPKGARDGYIERSVAGYLGSGTEPSFVDHAVSDWPMSYRAISCATACSAGDLTGDVAFGPWYRPNVDAALSEPPPVVEVRAAVDGVDLTIKMGAHESAPVAVVYRDDVYLTTLRNLQSEPGAHDGVVSFHDAEAPGPGSSYAVQACYSDCSPVAIANGFAQLTERSHSAS